MSDLISRTEAIETLNAYFVDMCSDIERWDMEQLLHAIEPQPDHRDEVIKGLMEALEWCVDALERDYRGSATDCEIPQDIRAILAAAKAVTKGNQND